MSAPLLSEEDFARLAESPAVRRRLRAITPDHLRALGRYLVLLPLWLLAAIYGGYALDRAGLHPGRWLFFGLLAAAILVPLAPLFRVRRHLRRPVLDQLAVLKGLDYASHDFELKAFKKAKPLLFGGTASETLTDLLAGREGADAYAVCHAEIRDGESRPAFTGLLHWHGGGARSGVALVVLPRAGEAAARAELPRTMRAVAFASDAAFDAAFVVHANRKADALALLDDGFRRTLLDFAAGGPVFLYLDRRQALLAGAGPRSFEPAGAVSRRPAARVRAIFDNAAAAFAAARRLRAHLG